MITNKLKLDLQMPGTTPTVNAVQNDSYSRNLEIALYSDHRPFAFPEKCTVVIRYKKSDGKGGEYDTLPDGTTAWWAERNILTVALAPQVLTTPGSVLLSVSLIADGKQLSIFPIRLSVEPIAASKLAKSEDYFYITGLLPAPASGKVGQSLRIAAVNSEGRITAVAAADSESLAQDVPDPTVYGLPVLYLTGDTTGMSKDNAVSLDYVYRDRSGSCTMKWQGSSSLAYPKKNYTIQFDNAFEAAAGWGEQKKYCLKANYIDHSHARNVVSAKLWGEIVKTRNVISPDNVNLFDISKIVRFENHIGDIIEWTKIENDSILVTSIMYNDGYNYFVGQSYSEGNYTVSFDVINDTTSTIEQLCIGFGVDNKNSEVYQVLNDSLQTTAHFEVVVTNKNPNAYFFAVPVNANGQVKLKIKNISIVKSTDTNLFEPAKITHFENQTGDGSHLDWAVINNDTLRITGSVANNGYPRMMGQTYETGDYTISFDAYNNLTSNDNNITVLVAAFIKPGGKVCEKEIQFTEKGEWIHCEVSVNNEVSGANLVIAPYYGVGSNAADVSFKNIQVEKQGTTDETTTGNVASRISGLVNGGAIDGFPTIIMLNDHFHGLYTFNIPKDGWMFGMGEGENEAILCADYSNASLFKGEATLNGDFDLEYVSDESNAEWVTTSVNRLINACMNSDGTDLDTTIAQYLDWESAVDYFILKNLLNGVDMGGKNYILATYDGVKWFFSAYDMDCVYGLDWDGKRFYSAKHGNAFSGGHTVDDLILTYKKDILKARYTELRNDVMSDDNVATMFTNFIGGIPTPLFMEDAKKWPTIPNTATNNVDQIIDYYTRRAKWLDEYMETL